MRKQIRTIALIGGLCLLGVTGCGNITVDGLLEDQSGVMLFTIFQDATGATVTNAAAAGTEVPNNVARAAVDLTSFTEARGQFSSSLTSTLISLRIEYSLDGGSNWSTLVPAFAASAVANANSKGGWGTIPTNAATDVLLRGVIVGNGVLDPVIRYIRLEVR